MAGRRFRFSWAALARYFRALGGGSVPIIIDTDVPDGIEDQAYSFTFSAAFGDPPLTWTVIAGSLPTGLNLSTGGLLSGTPTASGTFNYTVQVEDADLDTDTLVIEQVIATGWIPHLSPLGVSQRYTRRV